MKRLVKAFGEPTVLITDKAPALLCAFNKLIARALEFLHQNPKYDKAKKILHFNEYSCN